MSNAKHPQSPLPQDEAPAYSVPKISLVFSPAFHDAIAELTEAREKCAKARDGYHSIGRKIAEREGVPLVTLAVAWVLAHPAVTAPIIGASRPDQLEASLAAAEFTMSTELKDELDGATRSYRLGDAAR